MTCAYAYGGPERTLWEPSWSSSTAFLTGGKRWKRRRGDDEEERR